MSSFALSILLAVIACVIAGTIGGLTLARPQPMLGVAGVGEDPAASVNIATQGRAFGGMLVLAHGATALFLGYQPSVGAAMAFALAMAWLGASAGRAISLLTDPTRTPFNVGGLVFELLLGLTLALPFWNQGRMTFNGGVMV
ncbi:MAG: hypothetical protein JWP92_1487 [Caulobacter sp.]|nr:hypothetical protein [Caulobacter sp.]